MKISELLEKKKPIFSFEFFPPKTDGDEENLHSALEELRRLKPDFASVTHSPKDLSTKKTVELSKTIRDKFGIESMAHLPCLMYTKEQISQIISDLRENSINNVLALRGDRPKDSPIDCPNEYCYANELVKEFKRDPDFCIGVAGYPEKHPEAKSMEEDILNLKRKVDEGASFIITQLFFENRHYFDFLDKCRKVGISVPIIPGIMPISGYKQLQKFSEVCGVVIPNKIMSDLEKVKNDRHAIVEYGIDYALNQCRELLKNGAPGIHFYTLNKSRSTLKILQSLCKQDK
jgi:methylenetetrahydrofolate reductase (NADH)